MYAASVTYIITCITLVSIHTKRKRDSAFNTQRTVIPRHVPWPGMTIFSVFVVSIDTGNCSKKSTLRPRSGLTGVAVARPVVAPVPKAPGRGKA